MARFADTAAMDHLLRLAAGPTLQEPISRMVRLLIGVGYQAPRVTCTSFVVRSEVNCGAQKHFFLEARILKAIYVTVILPAVFAAAAWAQTPVIRSVENNYSNIVADLPNYGIAQGSIFFIKGSNLAPSTTSLQNVPLKTSLNGVNIQVTVNGTTTSPLIYYLSPAQIDAILPSSTPVGTGTITVTNNGATTATAPIQVVQSAFGLLTLNGGGTGMIAAFDANNNNSLLGVTAAANPGDYIVLWGSGLGPVASGVDESVLQTPADMSTQIRVDIGGIAADVKYHGRSQFPGLDQINVVVPVGVSGCAVSVAVETGGYVSNFGTLPVAANSRTCSDPALGLTTSQLQSIVNQGTYSAGAIMLTQTAATGASGIGEGGHVVPGATTTTVSGGASFWKVTVSPTFDFSALAQSVSVGSCTVFGGAGSNVSTYTGITPTPLNAGPKINVTAPGGSQSLTFANGLYSASLSSLLGPGIYTFDNGGGGPDVGALSTQLTVPVPLAWPDLQTFSTVTRSSGVTVNWTGGDPNSTVTISGLSFGSGTSGSLYGSFTCAAPVSAGTFTVPATVLLALPKSTVTEGVSTSTLSVVNTTNARSFTATGIDSGFVAATFDFSKIVTYQ